VGFWAERHFSSKIQRIYAIFYLKTVPTFDFKSGQKVGKWPENVKIL